MIYVYVDSLRMAYVQNLLHAHTLTDVNQLKENDTIIFPILDKSKRKLPLKKGELQLSSLSNMKVFLPFPYAFIKEKNEVYYYMNDEKLVLENAKLTAAGLLAYLGTLQAALNNVLIDVIGYGKCGKEIVKVLQSLQYQTRVIRRQADQEDQISLPDYRKMQKGHIVINTAVDILFTDGSLKDDNTQYVIDISSAHCITEDMLSTKTKLLYPGSLPNAFFPYSSANLICEFVKGK